jgi:WD40 repeat protein
LNFTRSESSLENDKFGCNSVSWAPFNPTLSQDGNGAMIHRITTGSCDNKVRVWARREGVQEWKEEKVSIAGSHSGSLVLLFNYDGSLT